MELPNTDEIKEYVADFREFLKEGTFPERAAATGRLDSSTLCTSRGTQSSYLV